VVGYRFFPLSTSLIFDFGNVPEVYCFFPLHFIRDVNISYVISVTYQLYLYIKLISEIYMQAVGILQCRLDDEYIMYVQMNYA
jgi:hypothetical protein